MAGIVVLTPQGLDFKLEQHPSLLPIAEDLTAAERAVIECSRAGCHSIWVVLPPDAPDYIREKIGDWVIDPVSYLGEGFKLARSIKNSRIKYIPIFYLSQQYPEQVKADSFIFNVLYAAKHIFYCNHSVAVYLSPHKFYVAMPWTIHDSLFLVQNRNIFSSGESNAVIQDYRANSAVHGYPLSFCFRPEDQSKLLQKFNEYYSQVERKEFFGGNLGRIPFAKQLKAVIGSLPDCQYVDIDWHHNISTWQQYRAYLSDPKSKKIIRPKNYFYRQYFQDPFKEIYDLKIGVEAAGIRKRLIGSTSVDTRFNVDAIENLPNNPGKKKEIEEVFSRHDSLEAKNKLASINQDIQKLLAESDWDFETIESELEQINREEED